MAKQIKLTILQFVSLVYLTMHIDKREVVIIPILVTGFPNGSVEQIYSCTHLALQHV